MDYFVSTGGSGGGAHAAMFAATSNNPDFYDYQIEAGAVGVYKDEDGNYSTTVSIDGKDYELSDGAWGCIAYSAITSLYEADMALAFEYYMDTTYKFNTSFQSQLAEYLSAAYMEYINGQNLSVSESAVGFDLNKDGDLDDTVALTIEYDEKGYSETNGYHGTYLDLYLAEFTENLQWYLDNLDYAEGWTWFDEKGSAFSDEEVASMTSEDKAKAFIEGRYTKGDSGKEGGGPDGRMPGGAPTGERPSGNMPDGGPTGEKPDGNMPEGGPTGEKTDGEMPNGEKPDGKNRIQDGMKDGNGKLGDGQNKEMEVGTPDKGTTQSATGNLDSANYETYEDMVAAYKADIEEINSGDKYGKNIVSLYNPLNYIGTDGTENPVWTKIVMGASEGDMSMFSSLNMQIAWLNAGVDSVIEWQWNGGHVPSEILGNSLSLYVDQMYGKYVDGAVAIEKQKAAAQTKNGTAEEMSGTDISSMVSADDVSNVSFSLADAVKYRTNGTSKATPAFDVIDYGQEDYVFGDTEADARHWNQFLLEIFEKHKDVLQPLYNAK